MKPSVEIVGKSSQMLTPFATGLESTFLHPLNETFKVFNKIQDAMSGESLGSNLMESDPILNSSERASKENPHMLGDSVSLPGEEPFPPRVNTVEGYPNPLTDPLAWYDFITTTAFKFFEVLEGLYVSFLSQP